MKKMAEMLLGAALFAAFSASADPLLYWMVDQSGSESPVDFQIAKVGYNTDGSTTAAGYLTLVDENGNTASSISGSGGSTAATWADLAGFDGSNPEYKFFVELLSWNDSTSSWDRMGQSAVGKYSDLVSNGSILPSSLDIGTAAMNVWVAPSVAIPEPSGALLMLVGGSLLALRRRRKVA